ncbi:hypothetical protein [Flavobacterium sp.]|uniref:hypothetical protein n=1 Tax=Flavobacterium sp. TaxID=239 RepID=UPI0038FC0CE4
MKNKYFFLFIALIALNACKKAENIEATMPTNNHFWEIKNKGGRPIIVNWEQYENDTIKIKTPIGWKIKKSKDSWIFFPYEKNNPKLYFSIMKYNVAEVNLNAEKYLIEGFKQISDKIDKFHYLLKKLSFANGTNCYLLTIFTKEKNRNYITYDLVYQPENIIYEFTFKTLDDEKNNEVNYRKFLLITQSLEVNNDMIMDGNKFIISEEKEIKIEDL